MSPTDADLSRSRTPTPRVSVIMPVYNTARYLRGMVESVLGQSFRDFELVAVDDGSTDESPAILREFAARDERVRVFLANHAGYGAALHQASRAARGEFLVIVDSDDAVLRDRIALQVSYLDSHPEIAAVGGQWFYCDEELNPLEIDCHSTDPDVTRTLTFAYQSVHNPTVCVRRTALDAAGGFDPSDVISVDTGFYARLHLAGLAIKSLPYIVLKWRRSTRGITHGRGPEQTLNADRVRRKAFAEVRRKDPRSAAAIARAILETFPEGTFLEDKLRTFTGRASRDYLLAALPPPRDARERAKRLLYEWFDDPAPVSEALENALREARITVLADLLALHDGRAAPYRPTEHSQLTREVARPATRLTVLVPFDGDREDLAARLDLLASGRVAAEAIVFALEAAAADARGYVASLPPRCSPAVRFEEGGFAAALATARTELLGYLLPRHRYDLDVLKAALEVVASGASPIACVALRKVYPYAMLDGLPAVEPNPSRSMAVGTLLGQGRLSPASFVHRAELLRELPLPAASLGDEGLEEALTCFLAHQARATVVAGNHDFLVDDVRLRDNALSRLARRLIRAYFDGGGVLARDELVASLPEKHLRAAILAADARHRAGTLRLYYANQERWRIAFERLPSLALRTALGRVVWRTSAAALGRRWRAAERHGFAMAAFPVASVLRAQKRLARLLGMASAREW